MDIDERWGKALSETEIIRPRVLDLMTFSSTEIPYILLSESSINEGDTVVRRGTVVVEKPALVLPFGLPRFDGFDLDKEKKRAEDLISNFLLVRGIKLPSLKYNNVTYSVDVFEGELKRAIDKYRNMLQKEENVSSGLIVGPEECWQFSLLIFVSSQVVKSADGDIKRLMEDYRKKREE